jgi:DNA-binding CsgD family transcriptional regulator/PAS domain-containing protein
MPVPLSQQDLSDLIGAIYDCALDPSRWEKTLWAIRDSLCCQTAVLHLNDIPNNHILINRSVGIEPHWLRQMQSHAPEIHGQLTQMLASWPSLDEPLVISRHISREFMQASPYFQECLKPQGLVDILQYFLIHTPTRLAGFAVGRHERQGSVTEREIEIGALLLPHIRRAVTISDVLDVRTIERARMAEALDALRCGVVLINAQGAILHVNWSAEHMLRDGGPIRIAGGTLQARAPWAAAELREAIRLAAQDEAGIGKTGLAIRLTEAETPAVFAHVLPLTGSELRTRLQSAAVAAVFIGAPLDAQDGAEVAAAAYGLTPAETRVLASLLGGRTLADTATALAIAPTTARTHLDSIFSKTGVTRQADLMRLGTGLVPPTRSRN